MLSFSQFLKEAGDGALPFKFDGEHDEYDQRYHRYSFQHNGKPFRVNIAHHDAPFPTAFVNFADYSQRPELGDMNVTGRARHGAVKVLSTVHNIVKHHLGKHPEIEEVRFTSSPDEPSREKLYARYAEKHGGISDPTGYDTIHVVPASAYKSSINEAGDSPLLFTTTAINQRGGANYEFEHNGTPYIAFVNHDKANSNTAHVYFMTKHGNVGVTGNAGASSGKVMSTMHNIIAHHLKRNPQIHTVLFTSDSTEPSRGKLYRRYTNKLGGHTEAGSGYAFYRIPASAYKTSINESEEPVRIKLGKGATGERAKQFMAEYGNDSTEHPFHRSARILHGATVDLSRDGNDVHMHDIVSLAPKSGAGTKALKHLTGLADKHGVKINLFAKAYSNRPEHIKSTKRLIKWYEKHGFKHDEPDYDVDYGSEMTYYPK
jgi:hypothetical protein